MTSRVMIFGGRGYLGGQFHALYPDSVCPDVDIADRAAVATALDFGPDVVVNCAGKTGRPNVDWCETHRTATLRANVTGVLVLLEECLARGMYLVHLGSGCIYTGDNGGVGFREEDAPNFAGSFYSRTKAWSDEILHDFPVLNIRLRMPFDGTTSERSLITKLCRYTRVLTTPNSLTHLPDMMRVVSELINRRATGTYNVVNPGMMSPFDVMTRYKSIVDPNHAFEPLAENRLGEVTTAGRSNCLLNTDKLRLAGLRMPPVQEAIDTALHQLAAHKAAMTSRAV